MVAMHPRRHLTIYSVVNSSRHLSKTKIVYLVRQLKLIQHKEERQEVGYLATKAITPLEDYFQNLQPHLERLRSNQQRVVEAYSALNNNQLLEASSEQSQVTSLKEVLCSRVSQLHQ